jgi:hypothetical protein
MNEVSHDLLRRLQELEKVVAPTANYVADGSEDVIFFNTGGSALTCSLRAQRGLRTSVVKVGGGSVVVSVQGGGTVNGAASKTISTDYAPLRLKAVAGNMLEV